MVASNPKSRIGTGLIFGALALAFIGWSIGRTWTPQRISHASGGVSTTFAALNSPTNNVTLSGTVNMLESDLLGRPSKVAIVSMDEGLLVETAIEDEAAGEELKEHVGEDVTASGMVKLKYDGTAAFVVSSFQVNAERTADAS